VQKKAATLANHKNDRAGKPWRSVGR